MGLISPSLNALIPLKRFLSSQHYSMNSSFRSCPARLRLGPHPFQAVRQGLHSQCRQSACHVGPSMHRQPRNHISIQESRTADCCHSQGAEFRRSHVRRFRIRSRTSPAVPRWNRIALDELRDSVGWNTDCPPANEMPVFGPSFCYVRLNCRASSAAAACSRVPRPTATAESPPGRPRSEPRCRPS